MTAATFAIAGIPPLAGFFSKDEILARAYEANPGVLVHRSYDCVHHLVLHVPAVVHDVLWRLSRPRSAQPWAYGCACARRTRRSSRKPDDDACAAHDPGGPVSRGRMGGNRQAASSTSSRRCLGMGASTVAPEALSRSTEVTLMTISVGAAFLGWYLAYVLYRSVRSCRRKLPTRWADCTRRWFTSTTSTNCTPRCL